MMDGNVAAHFQERQERHLPGELGLVWEVVANGEAKGRFTVEQKHMAPNGYLHAGTLVTLADTSCGYGCLGSLPAGATNFTTIELKSNFLGTTREGTIDCAATMVHGGRTTQVWDAVVTHRETGRTLALFRCTQMVLYPKATA